MLEVVVGWPAYVLAKPPAGGIAIHKKETLTAAGCASIKRRGDGMKVRSVFHPAVVCLGPEATLTSAATLMRAGELGSVAVYEADRLAGILTERDIVRAVAEHRDPDHTALSDYMSRDPVTAGPEEDSMDVALRMVDGGFRHLPVVEDGRLIGMVSARDMLQVEAWPPADFAERTGAASIDHPVRPTKHQLVQKPG